MSNGTKSPPLKVERQTMDVKAPLPDVHEVAMQIFLRTYMDTTKTHSYMAEKAYEAAEAFCEYARTRTA